MNWTGAKIKHIRENLHLTDAELGEQLGISASAVYSARRRTGIKKEYHFTKGEEDVIKGNPHLPGTQIAEMLGRSKDCVRRARRRWKGKHQAH